MDRHLEIQMSKGFITEEEIFKLAKLHARIVKISEENDIEVRRNAPTDRNPEGSVKADADALAELEGLDTDGSVRRLFELVLP